MQTMQESELSISSVQDALNVSEEMLMKAAGVNADGTDLQADPNSDTPTSQPGKDDEPTGVLAADGKSIIPYGVHKKLRADNEAAQRLAADAQAAQRAAEERAAALQERLSALEAGGQLEPGEESDDIRSELEALSSEVPAMAGLIGKIVDRIDAVRTQNATFAQREAERKAAEDAAAQSARAAAARTAEEVQAVSRAAIDSNTDLALWEVEDPAAFELAVTIDNQLQNSEAWKGKPLTELGKRFEEAVRRTRAAMPEAKRPAGSAALSQEQIAAAAAKAVRDASTPRAPTTLSDLPGGTSPGSNDLDVSAMETARLGNIMQGMSDQQIQAFLARHM